MWSAFWSDLSCWREPWAHWQASALGERARWEREAHWQARLSGRTLVRRGYFLSLWTEPLLFDDTEAEAVCVADQGQCGHAGEPGSNFATSHYRWRYWGRKGCVISATLIYHNFHVAIHLSKYKSSVKDWILFGLRLVQRQIFLIDFPLQSKYWWRRRRRRRGEDDGGERGRSHWEK